MPLQRPQRELIVNILMYEYTGSQHSIPGLIEQDAQLEAVDGLLPVAVRGRRY